MATVSAISRSRTLLHVRGNWSAREDRTASAVWLAILWVGTIVGFGVDIPRYLHEKPPPPMVLHVHAVVFTLWMLIVTAQVLLVLGDKVSWHRRFGWFAVGWVCLMAVLGPWAGMASQVATLHTPSSNPPFLSVIIVDLVQFFPLIAWGVALRKNPAAHKRMMMLSMVTLADPGFGRFSGWIWPNEPHSMVVWFFYTFYGNVLLLALMTVWDWWLGRLMRSFVIGAIAIVAAEALATWLYFWPPWAVLTHGWVVAWVKYLA